MKNYFTCFLSILSICFASHSQTIDNTFGDGNGFIINNFTSGIDGAQSVAIQSDGKIVVVGTSNGKLILVRYNTDGTFDTSFGTNGSVLTHFNFSQGWTNVLIQSDNKIVVSATDNYKPFVARYTTNGVLDATFGTAGVRPIVVLTIENSSTASIDAQNLDNIKLFPNPSTGKITIQSPNGLSESTVLVFNAMGQEIRNYQFSATNQIDLNLENVENGLYSIQIIDKNGTKSNFKIVKN